MQRCVLVCGAPIENYGDIVPYLRADDFVIACDCGLRHLEPLGIKPNLIVGDFDSYRKPAGDTETIVLPRAKDDTDSFYALKTALRRGYDNFLMIGAIGGRLDHSIGNLSMLLYLDAMGKTALALDDTGELEIVSDKPAHISDQYAYFSLLNITGKAKGISITDAKFPLTDGEITCEYQYGISNEPLPGKTACVRLTKGKLLLVRIRKDDHLD